MSLQLVKDENVVPVFNYSDSRFKIITNQENKKDYLVWVNPTLDPNVNMEMCNLFYRFYESKGLRYAPFEITVGELTLMNDNVLYLKLDADNDFIFQMSLYIFNFADYFYDIYCKEKDWGNLE